MDCYFDLICFRIIEILPGDKIRWGIFVSYDSDIGWILGIFIIFIGVCIAAFSQAIIAIREISLNTRTLTNTNNIFYKSLKTISNIIQYVGYLFISIGALLFLSCLLGIPRNTAYFRIDGKLISLVKVNARLYQKYPAENIVSYEVDKISGPIPVYPEEAIQSKYQDKVKIMITIDIDGNVEKVEFISGNDIFKESVLDAVYQWKFKPYFRYSFNEDVKYQEHYSRRAKFIEYIHFSLDPQKVY